MNAQPKIRETAEANQDAAPLRAVPVATPPAAEPAQVPIRKRRGGRFILMLALPVVLLVGGGYLWLSGGRYASTDNAYVRQDMVSVTADQPGRIIQVGASENNFVKQGDLLLQIDPEPYKIAEQQAQAAVAAARLQVEQLRSTYQQDLAEQKSDEQTLDYQQKNFKRQQDLLTRGVASNATFDTAQNTLMMAEQAVASAKEKVAGALTALAGDPNIPTDKHPLVQQAMAAEATAALALKETSVYSPANGIVAQADKLRIGQYVTNPAMMPTPLLSLVATDTTYVEANFKETDLTHMKVGQPATITLDTFPDRPIKAHVESIGAGTGSAFSLLPAQNATGNWVKVVQRLPVRLKIDDAIDLKTLRSGLSASVSVDTNYRRSLPFLGTASAAQ